MKILLLLTSFFFLIVSNAQNAGNISGVIVDSETQKPLAFATVTIYQAKDTSIITYRLSNEQGKFSVPGLPIENKPLRVLITHSGYSVFRKDFNLTESKPELNLDSIRLTQDSRSLETIIVLAERPPVIFKNDTIEFNASAFKTLPTALVEDLLKKLPGVTVDEYGNLSVNGRQVNRIQVDGKEYFGGDPKIATRNLPANIIDKVQVVDDKNELAFNPDASISTIGKVINLTLKKYIKKQTFGKVALGHGTNKRYEASAILNQFRDTLQISLLGFKNNINRAAFGYNDLRTLGGFSRSGMSNISVNAGGGIAINNISFGGTGEGIQETAGGGININNDFKKGINLNVQYFYGQTKNDISEINNRFQYLGDTLMTTQISEETIKKVFSHRIGTTLKLNQNPQTRIEFRSSFITSRQNTPLNSVTRNFDNYRGSLNESVITEDNSGNETSYSHNLLYLHSFKKKGRILNLIQSTNIGKVKNDRFNKATGVFFTNSQPIRDTIDQHRNRLNTNSSWSASINYTEPITPAFSFRLGDNFNYTQGGDELATADWNPMNGKYDVFRTALSSRLNRHIAFNTLSTGLNYKLKGLSLTLSGNYLHYNMKDRFKNAEEFRHEYNYLLPGLSANWKEFSISYNASVLPPSLAALQPVEDNSNPLFIVKGNPKLNPTINRNATFSFYKYYTTKQLSTNLYITSNLRNDAVVWIRNINEKAVQVSTPVNRNGLYDFLALVSVNKQMEISESLIMNLKGSFSYIKEKGFAQVNEFGTDVNSTELFPTVQFRITWRDIIEIMFSGNQAVRNTHYSNNFFTDLKTRIFRSYNELIVRWPKSFVFESNLTYQKNRNSGTGKSEINIWNAAVTYLFLKDNKGQIKLSVFDILDKNASISKFISENYLVEKQVKLQSQYFMATFYYDIRGFSKKAGGTERLLMF
jgi:hypothetical protein